MIVIQHRPEVMVMSQIIQGFVHNPDGMMRFAEVSVARYVAGNLADAGRSCR